MTKNRRWLKSVLAASQDIAVTLPWARGLRQWPILVPIPVAVTAPVRKPGLAAR